MVDNISILPMAPSGHLRRRPDGGRGETRARDVQQPEGLIKLGENRFSGSEAAACPTSERPAPVAGAP